MNRQTRRDLLDGMRESLPVTVAVAPFGLLFGALAVDNGLTVVEALMMSALIYAGASQMVGIELFGGTVAPWLVVLSIFAVNFRHVLYSAAVGRRIVHFSMVQKALAFFFLVDPQYASTESRAEQGKFVSFGWYMGLALPVYVTWTGTSLLGVIFGGLIEDSSAWGIDFLLPLYFLGLVLGFRRRPNWLPIVVASALGSIVAFHFIGSPWHVSVGALAGIAVAAILADTGRPTGRVSSEVE